MEGGLEGGKDKGRERPRDGQREIRKSRHLSGMSDDLLKNICLTYLHNTIDTERKKGREGEREIERWIRRL